MRAMQPGPSLHDFVLAKLQPSRRRIGKPRVSSRGKAAPRRLREPRR
jgi:hypothetical protein